jgi:hypothetical protein
LSMCQPGQGRRKTNRHTVYSLAPFEAYREACQQGQEGRRETYTVSQATRSPLQIWGEDVRGMDEKRGREERQWLRRSKTSRRSPFPRPINKTSTNNNVTYNATCCFCWESAFTVTDQAPVSSFSYFCCFKNEVDLHRRCPAHHT